MRSKLTALPHGLAALDELLQHLVADKVSFSIQSVTLRRTQFQLEVWIHGNVWSVTPHIRGGHRGRYPSLIALRGCSVPWMSPSMT